MTKYRSRSNNYGYKARGLLSMLKIGQHNTSLLYRLKEIRKNSTMNVTSRTKKIYKIYPEVEKK